MFNVNYVAVIPFIFSIISEIFHTKYLRYLNLFLSILVPICFFLSADNVHPNIFLYCLLFFLLSLFVMLRSDFLLSYYSVLQRLFFFAILAMLSSSVPYTIFYILISSVIIYNVKPAYLSSNELLLFATLNTIADICFLFYLFFDKTVILTQIFIYFGCFLKIVQYPFLRAISKNENDSYWGYVLIYLMSVLFLSFHLLSKIPFQLGHDVLMIAFTLFQLVFLIVLSYSILTVSLVRLLLLLSIAVSLKSFYYFLFIGNFDGSSYLISITILLILSLSIVYKELQRVFSKHFILDFFAAKEKVPFIMFFLFVIFLISGSFYGSIFYALDLRLIEQLYAQIGSPISIPGVFLYIVTTLLLIFSQVRLFTILFLSRDEVPWQLQVGKSGILGVRWMTFTCLFFILILFFGIQFIYFLNYPIKDSGFNFLYGIFILLTIISSVIITKLNIKRFVYFAEISKALSRRLSELTFLSQLNNAHDQLHSKGIYVLERVKLIFKVCFEKACKVVPRESCLEKLSRDENIFVMMISIVGILCIAMML